MTVFGLGPRAIAAGYRLAAFDSVGSTNSEAANALASGDPGPTWFAALQQTAGRGRRGRQWATPYGNLAASLLIRPEAESGVVATLGFVAGIALSKALADVLPDAAVKSGIDGAEDRTGTYPTRIELKWPNDVVADGAKLAGILLEARTAPDGRQALIIGIGVNVVSSPEDLPYPATSITKLGRSVEAPDIFASLSEQWVGACSEWDNGRGIAPILRQWRASAAGIGADVTIRTHGEVVRGIFETIDDTGRLIVRLRDGRRTPISAGDVHFGTTASVK